MTPESKLLLVIGKIPASKRGKSTSLLIPIPSSIRDCPNYQIFACYLGHFISLYFMISPSSCSHFIAVTPRSHLLHFGHENPFPDGERDDWFIHRVVPLVPSGWWFQHVSTILKNMSSSMGRMTSRKYYGKMKVNGKDDIPYITENKTCLKPPTSHYTKLSSPQLLMVK
jgi:hypothetical protein